MSLLRQLLVIASLVVVCVLVGILALGVGRLEQNLNYQMQIQAKSYIENISYSLSAITDAESRLELLENSYRQADIIKLSLQSADGTSLFNQSRPSTAGQLNSWSGLIVDLQPVSVQADIADVGQLKLELDTTNYWQIINTYIMQWFWLLLAVIVLWAIFLIALKARLRKMLRYILQEPEIRVKPPADDLAEAELLDAMQERVAPTVDEQMARIEQLEIELNRDPVTGLANRTYFLNELKRVLRDDARQGAVSGYVLLVRQRDMSRLQNQTGREEIDDWLRLLGKRILEVIEMYPAAKTIAARLNGADFVFLFPVGGGPEVMEPIQKLQVIFDSLRVKIDSHNLSRCAFALTDYTENCSTKEVLTRLDVALMSAESAGHGEIEFISHADSEKGKLTMGEASWRTLITQALDHDKLSLAVQKANYEGDDIVDRYEASLILYEDDPDQSPISGYLFMPPATRLGLSSACDMRALSLALGWLGENTNGVLVIRMSITSFMESHYLEEIKTICEFADQSLLPRVVIELNAYGLIKNFDAFKIFADGIIDLGMHVGLRGLDTQPDALRRIHEINFVYVKLGGKFITELLSSPGGIQMLVAVTETAIGMGMRVYVDGVRDQETRQMVQEYGALPRASQPATDSNTAA